MGEEEADRNFKAQMEEMEFSLSETPAELHAHFLFINALVSQLGSSCTGSSGRPHAHRAAAGGSKGAGQSRAGWRTGAVQFRLRMQGLGMPGPEVRQP